MTDSLETDKQDIPEDPAISDDVAQDSAPVEALDKATVSKIVARERAKAYEKGKREAMMELEQQQAPQAPVAAQQQPQTFGGMPQVPHEELQRMVAEMIPQHLHAQAEEFRNKQFVDSFVSKMQAAEKQYPGLEAKLNDIDFNRPGTQMLVQMANNMDNTGAIMHELLENPEKMGTLLNLVHEQPKLAQQRLASLGQSIKVNQDALQQEQSANEPIRQIKSSVNAGVDDHNLSVKDLKKMLLKGR